MIGGNALTLLHHLGSVSLPYGVASFYFSHRLQVFMMKTFGSVDGAGSDADDDDDEPQTAPERVNNVRR